MQSQKARVFELEITQKWFYTFKKRISSVKLGFIKEYVLNLDARPNWICHSALNTVENTGRAFFMHVFLNPRKFFIEVH